MTDHVRTEAGVRKYHEPIGSPIVSHEQAREKLLDVVSALEQEQAGFGSSDAAMESYIAKAKAIIKGNPELADDPLVSGHAEITGKPPPYASVAASYGWDEIDPIGSDGRQITDDSIHVGHQSQINAKFWQANVGAGDPDDDQYAASLWQQYQSPQLYGAINGTLRTGKPQYVDGDEGPAPEDMERYVDLMFKKGGTVLDHDIVLYRALHSSNQPQASGVPDWAEKLQPGTDFTDKGIMSTTPHPKFAQGWLGLDSQGYEVDAQKPDDVVLELHVPKGTTIMGGDPQFIEVMLGRGTTFHVVSAEQRRAESPQNPLHAKGEDPFTYTHVVAEVTTK